MPRVGFSLAPGGVTGSQTWTVMVPDIDPSGENYSTVTGVKLEDHKTYEFFLLPYEGHYFRLPDKGSVTLAPASKGKTR